MGCSRLFLISYLIYDVLWTSMSFYKLPQDYYVRKVLIYLSIYGLSETLYFTWSVCSSDA